MHKPTRGSRSARTHLWSLLLILLVAATAPAQESQVLRGHQAAILCLDYSPEGDLLISGGTDHAVKFWPLREPRIDPQQQAQHSQWLADLDDDCFDVRQQAGDRLAAEGHQVEGRLQGLLDTTPSAEVRLRVRYLLAALAVPPGVGHLGDVRSLACSHDGQLVASGSRDNTLRLWRVSSGRTIAAFNAHTDGVWAVAFSPDSSLLASGGGDHLIRLWHHASGTLTAILAGHSSTIQHLAFSPDGRTLASAGGFDRTIKLWDVVTGQLLDTLVRHQDAVLCLAFSPDGSQLASAGYEGIIHLWDCDVQQHLAEIPVGATVVRAVAFAPHGDLLAASGDDRLVRFWNTRTRQPLATLSGHGAAIHTLVFAPDGQTLATADREGLIRLWSLPVIPAAMGQFGNGSPERMPRRPEIFERKHFRSLREHPR